MTLIIGIYLLIGTFIGMDGVNTMYPNDPPGMKMMLVFSCSILWLPVMIYAMFSED